MIDTSLASHLTVASALGLPVARGLIFSPSQLQAEVDREMATAKPEHHTALLVVATGSHPATGPAQADAHLVLAHRSEGGAWKYGLVGGAHFEQGAKPDLSGGVFLEGSW